MIRRAFDLGITHFDLANNYGPPYGSAEINFGRIFEEDLKALPGRDRDLDQGRLRHVARAVRRVGLAQVPAGQPRAEPASGCAWTTSTSSTRTASIPRRRSRRRWARSTPRCAQGKARYAGISSYSPRRTEEAALILRELGTPLLIHQPSYSMLNRWIEEELLDVLDREGVGTIVFSPLAQGLLTDRYLDGVPEDSRVRIGNYFRGAMLSEENLARVRALNEIAQRRGQSLAQMAIAWVLRDPRITSALLGASSVRQLEQNVAALERLDFDPGELEEIDRYAGDGGINLWAASSDE